MSCAEGSTQKARLLAKPTERSSRLGGSSGKPGKTAKIPTSALAPGQTPAGVATELARYFKRNGYVRCQNPERVACDGWKGYKKGDEIRLTANDRQELVRLQKLVRRVGFRPGRPFAKDQQYRLPIYGREAVRRFLRMVETPG